jgi:hypothetical protein
MRRIVYSLLLATLASPAAGQDLQKGVFPDGYHVRTDRADQSPDSIVFVTMEPGWHITTGPAVILYDASRTEGGAYRVESEFFLFDPGQRNEAFGLFIGGRNLDGPDQAYTYFLIRPSGEFLVKRRAGEATPVVREWAENDAIVKWTERAEDEVTARNVLAVEVGPDAVLFFANDRELARVPRSELDTEGVVGLRVNHALNLHVSSLEVTRR